MRLLTKTLPPLLIALLAASTLITVQSAFAQSTAKPPIPQFTLKFIDASYDVPTTYSTNPYTGENVTHQGYHVDNRTINISIENSNFASSLGKSFFLYYNVQIKGHSVENWTNLFSYVPNSPTGLLPQSDSQNTIISESVQSLPTNVPLDFRIQSSLVNQTLNFEIVETSDWSSIQTITIGNNNPSSTPTQTQIPPMTTTFLTINTGAETPQSLPISVGTVLIVASLAIIAVVIASLLSYKRSQKIPKTSRDGEI
jgi:hypothetical protein